MKLRVSDELKFANIDAIRSALEGVEGEEEVEFTIGSGAGVLRWSHPDLTTYNVHIAIPIAWFTDADKTDRLETAVRHFAYGVRVACKASAEFHRAVRVPVSHEGYPVPEGARFGNAEDDRSLSPR